METIKEKLNDLTTINIYIIPTIQCDDVPPFEDIKKGREIIKFLFDAFKDKDIKFTSAFLRKEVWEQFIEQKNAFNYNCDERFRIWGEYSARRRDRFLDELFPLYFSELTDDIFFFDRMNKDKMKRFGSDLKEIDGRVREAGVKLTKEDRVIVVNRIIEIRESHNVFWSRYKEIGNEEFLKNRKEKNKDFLNGLIEKDKEFLEKLETTKEKIERNLDKLQDMRNDAKGDEHRDRVDGWIDENKEQLDSIKSKIRSVEEQIYKKESEIRDL